MRIKIEGILTLHLDGVDIEQVQHKATAQCITLEKALKEELRSCCQRMCATPLGEPTAIYSENKAIVAGGFWFRKERPVHD